MIEMDKAIFSEDKTAFGIMTEHGIYINTTGRALEPEEVKPATMRCVRCGAIYKNATLLTVPHPCPCGGIAFETIAGSQEAEKGEAE